MTEQFVSIFKQPTAPAARGKYLSRVFGIFSEEIVRIWARDVRAPYEDLGRPTLRAVGERLGSTLDFTLRSRKTGKVYVAELKCEIEYKNYRNFVLVETGQIDHHKKPAFAAFLAAAARPFDQKVFVGKRETGIDGAILVWGATNPVGRTAVMNERAFSDVLTMAEIVADLRAWRSEAYRELVEQRRAWSNEMYESLLGADPIEGGANTGRSSTVTPRLNR